MYVAEEDRQSPEPAPRCARLIDPEYFAELEALVEHAKKLSLDPTLPRRKLTTLRQRLATLAKLEPRQAYWERDEDVAKRVDREARFVALAKKVYARR